MRCALYAFTAFGLLAACGCTRQQTNPASPLAPKTEQFAPLAGKSQSFNNSQLPTSTSTMTHAMVKGEKKPEGPKRPPKVETCLKMGQTFEEAADKSDDSALREQRLTQARLAYQQALELDAKNSQATFGLARVFDKQGDYDSALAGYREAAKLRPNDAQVFHELGMCHARLKDWDAAIEALRKAVTLSPANMTYSNNLGWTLARSGQYDASLEHFRRTLGPARAHYNLALMMNHLGFKEPCRRYAYHALKLDPALEEARVLIEKVESGTAQAAAKSKTEVETAIQPVDYREPVKTTPKKKKAKSAATTETKPAAAKPPKTLKTTSMKPDQSAASKGDVRAKATPEAAETEAPVLGIEQPNDNSAEALLELNEAAADEQAAPEKKQEDD
jgi:tetratricopeptide (TPR) repeat protein